ncbi:MAG TPA: dihydrolipoamide acetyltransferase family protein [Candidatus Saccharimonadales bacterium]|nr:dihydrolipoamide acetyltransferase family protein [Candidatus Saccharimonadales bacterium]
MSTKVTMPQMGESIAEGTITKWLKKVGDAVERDEPLFEISTDKVDSVIPAPAGGVLLSIDVPEGATVEINTQVGLIGEAGEAAAGAPAAQAAAPAAAAAPAPAPKPVAAPPAAPAVTATRSTLPSAAVPAPPPAAPGVTQKRDGAGRVLTSPLVRNMARQLGIDLADVSGTGFQNRVTKEDVEAFVKRGGAAAAPAAAAPSAAPAGPLRPAAAPPAAPAPAQVAAASYTAFEAAVPALPGDVWEPMNHVQKRMAEHMWRAKQLIPHVTTVFEFDVSRIVALRAKEKERFEAETGTKLTYMPFYARAVVEALKKMPIMNASVQGDHIVFHREVNIGIAVALDWGLIVPVVRNAEEKSFLGLARAINDLAARARGKQLKPEEIQGGTFSITNPGVFGSLFGTPIIAPPQVGILDLGAIQKRPVVVEGETGDSIAVRSMQYCAVAFDHRVMGGAEADKFMNLIKDRIENWSESIY